MRKWIDLLEDASQYSSYGYWISPQGIQYPVANQGHEEAIEEIENTDYGSAIAAGWIRVVCREGETDLQLEACPNITNRSISVLSRIARKGKFSKFYLDLHFEPGEMKSREANSLPRAIEQLRELQARGGWEQYA